MVLTSVSFKYDPFGRRIYKSSSSATGAYAYDGDNLVEETNSAGGVVARYVPFDQTQIQPCASNQICPRQYRALCPSRLENLPTYPYARSIRRQQPLHSQGLYRCHRYKSSLTSKIPQWLSSFAQNVQIPRISKQAISPFAGHFLCDFEFCKAFKSTRDGGEG